MTADINCVNYIIILFFADEVSCYGLLPSAYSFTFYIRFDIIHRQESLTAYEPFEFRITEKDTWR